MAFGFSVPPGTLSGTAARGDHRLANRAGNLFAVLSVIPETES
jgi:hypothetical protein